MSDLILPKQANQKIDRIDKKRSLLYTPLAQSAKNKSDIISINIKTHNHDYLDERFIHSFFIYCLYSPQEKIKNIFKTIERYLSKIYCPIQIEILRTHRNESFAGYFRYSIPIFLKEAITAFSKYDIRNKGLSVVVNGVYEHKIDSVPITCQYMNRLKINDPLKCPIYYAMKQQYEYSLDNLSHLYSFQHFENEYASKPSCKYGQDCKAYIRHETGKDGDRLNDKCHIKIYKHPPRRRFIKLSEDIHSFIINKSKAENHKLYTLKKDDKKKYEFNKKDGYLKALIKEVIYNGFKYDLCLECGKGDDCQHTEYSILQIVDEKIKHNRHKQMNSPLRRDHMLALILYTGCDCNWYLCDEQRKGNYKKWIWFDRLLYKAIELLSKREKGDFMVYSGLGGVKLDVKEVKNGYFVTYVSASWQKKVSQTFMGGNKGMIMQINKEYKNDDIIRCCDVSWISKFPDECEILFARTLHKNKRFSCVVLDDSNGVQTVSLTKGYK